MKKRILTIIAVLSAISLSSCGVISHVEQPSTADYTLSRGETVTQNKLEISKSEMTTSTESSDGSAIPVLITTALGESSATATATTTTAVTAPPVMRGNLYDANNELLMFSSMGADGKEERMTNDSNKVAFANVLNEMSEGLDLTYDKQLRTENPVQPGENKVGQSIQLTFDSKIQNAIYDYMNSMGIIGSAVVMRSDGSIMAQVSYPSYNPDDYYGKKTDEDLAWGNYGNKCFQNFPPGSCFKIMSEVISDKHEIYSLYDEGKWEFDGTSIVNWDHDTNWGYPMQRSLSSAFVNSSNIFFARSFDTIGTDAVMNDLESIFHFVTPINCDFGTINNNIEINCNDDLRRTAFGQSYVMTCPIYLAALGREAAFGDMVKPFTIKNIVDTSDPDHIIMSGSMDHELLGTIPKEYRQNLLDGMSGVASGLGISIPSGYSFYAKTGTAETWEGDFLYITGIVKKNTDDGSKHYASYSDYNDSYIIVTQIRNPQAFGYSFASHSAPLYQGIVNCVVG